MLSSPLPEVELQPQPVAELIAPHPFNDRSADVILRSCDEIHFYVYKVILSYASGFFRDLFDLGQPSACGAGPNEGSSGSSVPPVIDVPEHSSQLEQILLWCYPIPHPELKDILTIKSILKIAVKYDMAGVISYMRRPLWDLRTAHPIDVFAISCTHYFHDIATDAAKVLREQHGRRYYSENPNPDWNTTIPYAIYSEELAHIRSASFLRLLQFVRDGTMPEDFCRSRSKVGKKKYLFVDLHYPDADLIIRSQLDPSIDFRVHRSIISFSSSILKAKIQSDSILLADVPTDSDTLPILELPEGCAVLGLLLNSCYPSDGLDPSTFDPIYIPPLAAAAKKYGMERAVSLCKKRLADLALTQPFQAFYLAVKCNWKEEAREAAVYVTQLSAEENYHPSMENLDTEVYYLLLKFCHEYRQILSSIPPQFSAVQVNNYPPPTVSKAFSQYSDIWDPQDQIHLRDTACVLAATCSYRGSCPNRRMSTIEQYRDIYKQVTEQTSKLQIQWRDTSQGKSQH